MKTATILLIATILFSIGIHAQQDESAAIDQLLTDWHNGE